MRIYATVLNYKSPKFSPSMKILLNPNNYYYVGEIIRFSDKKTYRVIERERHDKITIIETKPDGKYYFDYFCEHCGKGYVGTFNNDNERVICEKEICDDDIDYPYILPKF